MQVSVENTSGLERRLTVQVPGQEVQDKIDAKLRELSKQVQVKGFRPGRVPISVVKQRYGKQVRQDIVNETVQSSLQQAIQDEDLRPASMPRLEADPENNDGGDFEFSALIEVYPEIGKLDVAEMSIERPDAGVGDQDVEEMLGTLRKQRISWNTVERPAESGDQVVFEYAAETGDGRLPPEGKNRLSVVMGDSGFDELEKAIVSIPVGEETNIELTFPEDFREPDLAGKEARVDLQVTSVSEGILPDIDAEFIRSFGVEDGELESFKKEIRGNLERELKQATSTLLKARLIEALINASPDLEVPASIVRDEAANMAAQLVQSQNQKLNPDQMESLVEPFMGQAEGRVRAGLLLGELAQQNNIRVDPAKVREAIEIAASTYEQPTEVVQLYYSNQQLLQQVESSVLEEQVVDWVLENAKVTHTEMNFQEVIKAATSRS
jgi:trigger factor